MDKSEEEEALNGGRFINLSIGISGKRTNKWSLGDYLSVLCSY